MQTIKVSTSAKVNLTLEIVNKRPDGFHNINSIMQTIDIFDYLTISVTDNVPNNRQNSIVLTGNSTLIPYDSSNLVYKTAEKFLEKSGIDGKMISVYIEKNIPVAAGLAGGSSNAAGTLIALNEIFNNKLTKDEIHQIASELGSDINFCIEGGTQVATSRGELLEKIGTPFLKFVVAKPKHLFISAKEAYTKYVEMLKKPDFRNTQKMIELINKSQNVDISAEIASLLNNDLETAIINDYEQISSLKSKLVNSGCINAMMSGSGPTVFGITDKPIEIGLGDDFDVFNAKSIDYGVKIL